MFEKEAVKVAAQIAEAYEKAGFGKEQSNAAP